METEENVSQQPTAASEWRGRKGVALPLPSGNTALVRPPGIQHFLRSGSIPNSLKGLIRKAMDKDARGKFEDIFDNEEDLEALFDLFDRVLLQVVIEPKVNPVPLKEVEEGEQIPVPLEERDQDVIYVDEVDMNDKAFIFQYAVGGTRDLERFREEQGSGLADVLSGQSMESETQPVSGDN